MSELLAGKVGVEGWDWGGDTYKCTIAVKKRDLEAKLRRLGWWFLRHGRRHDVWTDGERQEAIPRHSEIHEKLARAILKRAKRSAKP